MEKNYYKEMAKGLFIFMGIHIILAFLAFSSMGDLSGTDGSRAGNSIGLNLGASFLVTHALYSFKLLNVEKHPPKKYAIIVSASIFLVRIIIPAILLSSYN